MEPVRLEILLDDKTLKGLRSVEGNLSGIGLYAKQVIAQLEQELATLQKSRPWPQERIPTPRWRTSKRCRELSDN